MRQLRLESIKNRATSDPVSFLVHRAGLSSSGGLHPLNQEIKVWGRELGLLVGKQGQ
jgi:hypothetical protein